MSPQDMLTTKQAAEALGIESDTLRKWRYLGKGPAYHRYPSVNGGSGRCYYRQRDVDRWLKARRRVTR